MKKASVNEILKIAGELADAKADWHFHLLTPGCVFNKEKRFALILEDMLSGIEYVNLSVKKPEEAGMKLAELLHGSIKTAKKRSANIKLDVKSPKVRQMIKMATQLNIKGFAWHHHLLYPECIFNHDKRYWTLVFEDLLNNVDIREMFASEPKKELKKIEQLFYNHDNK